MFENWQSARVDLAEKRMEEWRTIKNLLKRTDQNLYVRVGRKMMNYLSWHGVEEAQQYLQHFGYGKGNDKYEDSVDLNRPQEKTTMQNIVQISDEIFNIASEHLSNEEIFSCIQKWIHEDKSSFLIRTLENLQSTLSDISDAITRYYHLAPEGVELSESARKAVNVSLIRRFFTDQLEFINIAKNYVDVGDFHVMLQNMIYPTGSQGKLGGKSAGLFLAQQIIRRVSKKNELLKQVKVPETWYISSDGLLNFLHHNNLEEINEQKYKEIEQIRQEYPHVIQLFKNSQFPIEIVQGLSVMLDELGEKPIIVRSSSLLEDRLGSAFSGKYKSLFLANQGNKEQRLEALLDAIAEVYASTVGPDPIQYRAERGLLDFHEEMGIMIQEVVGHRVSHYFFPAFAGVAFSHNEFRWSPRINREDGLIRLVPGLGTRAVDRLSDDYPILVAPGQPNLRVNVSPDEVIRYSPQKIDVIDLDKNRFVTLEISELMKEIGDEYPQIHRLISIVKDKHIKNPFGISLNFDKDDFIFTFDNLITNSDFVEQVKMILDNLKAKLKTPIDIEFAHDGENFYLLQCRPQSYTQDEVDVPIPKDVSEDKIIFSAQRYISNGVVPDITHIVYVDPEAYVKISDLSKLKEVGRAVSKLNKLLPKKQFILMGPGRWGSRGDIKLGVSVTYSDINNTAALIEIARQKGNYVPDLSFGTHFFQDLIESSIQYIPLYPDEKGILFNEKFLEGSPNIFEELVPEFDELSDVIRVIDVPSSTDGSVMRILLNAELEEGLGFLSSPEATLDVGKKIRYSATKPELDHSRWRMQMVQQIAAELDPTRFGVKSFYVFGSTKNAMAGPASDIDLLIHFTGTENQRKKLLLWLEGWSLCLAKMNYLRTGYKTDGLLDIHLVSDQEVKLRSGYASKIDAITDPAKILNIKEKKQSA
jgi:hypothetical protein